jgi:hypothetical protein
VGFWEGGEGEGTGEVRGTVQLFTIFIKFAIFTLFYPERDLNLPFGGSFSCYFLWFWYPPVFIYVFPVIILCLFGEVPRCISI